MKVQQHKLIISAVLGFWLIGLAIPEDPPGWLVAPLFVFGFLAIGGLVAFLMTRGSGWQALARKHPQGTPYDGPFRRCRTFQMIATGSGERFGTRFSGIVSVGSTAEALYIAAPSIVRFLFPTIRLPWFAIASAKPFEAPGWVKPMVESGALVQAEYDPGYTREFLELETAAPKTCIRLPVYAIGDSLRNLPLSAPAIQ